MVTIRELHMNTWTGLIDGKSFTDRVPEPGAVIAFAHEFDMPSLMPTAFYVLAGIPLRREWDEGHAKRMHDVAEEAERLVRWKMLSGGDMTRLTRAREVLARRIALIVDRYLEEHEHGLDVMEEVMPNAGCSTITRCIEAFSKSVTSSWRQSVFRPSNLALDMVCPDPIGLLQKMLDHSHEWGICDSCKDSLRRHIRGCQKAAWDALQNIL